MNTETLLEQEILAAFERGEWKPVRNQKGEIARFRAVLVEERRRVTSRSSGRGPKRRAV